MSSQNEKKKALLSTPFGDVFLVLYLTATLGVRFMLEHQLSGRPLISVSIGLFALLLLWALKRVGFFLAKLWP